MTSKPLTRGALARAAGMSEEDVRLYLDRGLLQPPRRRRGRSNDVAFHREHVERLKLIGRALAYGFTHDDIAVFVDPGLVTCDDVYRIAAARLEKLKELTGAASPQVAALEQLMALCTRTEGRLGCAILSALSA